MAGDWIKMRGNLWDDPRVGRLVDLTSTSEAAVIGALYWLWATADQHTEDGILPGLSLRQIDRKTGVQGFGSALVEVGWLADHPEGVRIARFEEHNGTSAKRRCTDAQRKANSRNVSASDADNERTRGGQVAPDLGAREEKRREEESNTATSDDVAPARPVDEAAPALALVAAKPKPKTWAPPDCPHLQVLALWAEVLPAMPQHLPEQWRGTRADHLRARWRETAEAKKWSEAADGLDYLRRLFAYIGQSRFLTGRTKTKADSTPFVIELAWLVSPQNWAKVHEGKYHQEVA